MHVYLGDRRVRVQGRMTSNNHRTHSQVLTRVLAVMLAPQRQYTLRLECKRVLGAQHIKVVLVCACVDERGERNTHAKDPHVKASVCCPTPADMFGYECNTLPATVTMHAPVS